jgi:hypothetical protein
MTLREEEAEAEAGGAAARRGAGARCGRRGFWFARQRTADAQR